jgi:predicted extracellular nuclease
VVNFSKGSGGSGDENYRILPTISSFNTVNTRTNIPPSVGGTLKIIGLNVLYFKTLDASEIKLRTAAVHVERITKQNLIDKEKN